MRYLIVIIIGIFLGGCQWSSSFSEHVTAMHPTTKGLTVTNDLTEQIYQPNDNPLSMLIAVRIDPAHYQFRAHYRPEEPLTLREWRAQLPDAVLIINANFFDVQRRVLGLLIADGQVYGQSYSNRGGRFVIQDGQPLVLSNVAQPYRGEKLEQAVQAFPMLVADGVQAYTNVHDRQIARRTVIGQDGFGHILILVTPSLGLSLYDLSLFLAQSDMDLVNAFNLDGGGSTMFYNATTGREVASFDPVPAVLAVYRR